MREFQQVYGLRTNFNVHDGIVVAGGRYTCDNAEHCQARPGQYITQALPNTCPRLAQQRRLPGSLAAPPPDDFSWHGANTKSLDAGAHRQKEIDSQESRLG
jgi:hypothetical protein